MASDNPYASPLELGSDVDAAAMEGELPIAHQT